MRTAGNPHDGSMHTCTPVLPPLSNEDSTDSAPEDPESISLDELEAEFERFRRERETEELAEVNDQEVLEGKVYDFDEYERVEKGQVPASYAEQVKVVTDKADKSWDVALLMAQNGVSL